MKKQILVAAVLGAASFSAGAADYSANAGFVSNYIFRGADASNGKAAAQGGLDAAWDNGLYVGTWTSTVDAANTQVGGGADDSGLEIDLYGGWAKEFGDFNIGIGGTYYTFTDNIVDDFVELNLSGGWKWFTVTINPGQYDSDPNSEDPLVPNGQDYVFYSLKGELNGFYAVAGHWDWDSGKAGEDDALQDGSYFELGYTDTLSVNEIDLFDYSFSYVYAENDVVANDQSSNTLVFGISKSFSLLQ
jgi:uncharacterized protein (TIGR02001 family)